MNFEMAEADRKPKRIPAWVLIGGAVALGMLFLLIVAAVVVVPNVLRQLEMVKAKARAVNDLIQIDSALDEYARLNAGQYPESLQVLVLQDENGRTFLGSTVLPKDPWGNDYLYTPPDGASGVPIVCTLGKDGRKGGDGEDADMDNVSGRPAR